MCKSFCNKAQNAISNYGLIFAILMESKRQSQLEVKYVCAFTHADEV